MYYFEALTQFFQDDPLLTEDDNWSGKFELNNIPFAQQSKCADRAAW